MAEKERIAVSSEKTLETRTKHYEEIIKNIKNDLLEKDKQIDKLNEEVENQEASRLQLNNKITELQSTLDSTVQDYKSLVKSMEENHQQQIESLKKEKEMELKAAKQREVDLNIEKQTAIKELKDQIFKLQDIIATLEEEKQELVSK